MNVPFASEKDRLVKAFAKVVKRGNETFYQARLSKAEVDMLRKRRFVTFTEQLRSTGSYSNISEAHETSYTPEADRLWARCFDSLS